MPQHRRAAWALVATLVSTMSFAAPAFAAGGPVNDTLVDDPAKVCSPGQMPTDWQDELRPPSTVRVLRSKGPTKGDVDVVPFWKYVGRVVRAEYSSGGTKPYPWMHIGALSVKQYGWYSAMHWRGGRVHKTNPDGSVTTKCFDLKDTTADQIYTDLKVDPNDPTLWIEANVPTTANLTAMRETWHMTLRKWQADKNKSRFYLTGYRSGKQFPCGDDSTGFKIFQKSLRDCGTKNLTFEEVLREYYEPGLIVDARLHDVLADSGDWRGDLAMVNPATGAWAMFKGSADSFTAGPTGTFSSLSPIAGQGIGNVDMPADTGADDDKILADLILLTGNSGNRSVAVARATGNGFNSPTSQSAPNAAERLVVGDFNGDLLADAGLLSAVSATEAKLQVMQANGSGGFTGAVDWWQGPLALASELAMAGDVNGDGKADLIMRNSVGAYSAALSRASCSNMGSWGVCPAGAVGADGLNQATAWLPASAVLGSAKHAVGDYDRDGRDDVIAVVPDGSGIKVFGMRAKVDGTGFADPQLLWSGNLNFAELTPLALNVNSDGMADLALATNQNGETRMQWLRANERTTTPATMTMMTPFDSTFDWNVNNRAF